MSNVDRTKLNALIPNLEVGQVAEPELRQVVFEEVYTLLEQRAAEADVLLKANSAVFIPAANYHPATKKYVDDTVAGVVLGTVPDGSISKQKQSIDMQTASVGGQIYAYKNFGGL